MNLDAVPHELRTVPHWLLWREEPGKDGRPTKKPYGARGGAGSSTDSSTWSTFDDALAALDASRASSSPYRGLGFAIEGTGLVGVDLDACLCDGELHPVARALVARLGTYAEVSPSGAGVRIIGRGRCPGSRCETGNVPWSADGVKFEFAWFDSGRYFTVTGDVLKGFEQVRFVDPEVLETVMTEMFPANGHSQRQRSARAQSEEGGRAPETLITQYPKLDKIAYRKGRSKPSSSEWDWHLACEARRSVRPPISAEEARALLDHARALNDEEKRDEALRTTVEKAFEEVDGVVEPYARAREQFLLLTVDPCARRGDYTVYTIFLVEIEVSARTVYRPGAGASSPSGSMRESKPRKLEHGDVSRLLDPTSADYLRHCGVSVVEHWGRFTLIAPSGEVIEHRGRSLANVRVEPVREFCADPLDESLSDAISRRPDCPPDVLARADRFAQDWARVIAGEKSTPEPPSEVTWSWGSVRELLQARERTAIRRTRSARTGLVPFVDDGPPRKVATWHGGPLDGRRVSVRRALRHRGRDKVSALAFAPVLSPTMAATSDEPMLAVSGNSSAHSLASCSCARR